MSDLLIEVCIEGLDHLLAAQQGGADRVELCASLMEGGLTPSLGTVRQALRLARVPVQVMVRPRGGDFLYSDAEFASMLDDVALFRDAGAAGVVFGCLCADGTVDAARTAALVAAARPCSVTFHRAFDMTRDPVEALEALIGCAVDRVLTSGQCADAVQGAAALRRLDGQAAGRIIVLGCGELRPETIGQVRRETGLRELHFAALAETASPMQYRNTTIGMGSAALEREYRRSVTDPDRVARTIRAAREAGHG
jgi:copper homeostasis protein